MQDGGSQPNGQGQAAASLRPFAEVQADIEAKFVDLELKVLTALQFDFDYDCGTPFAFLQMFLSVHFQKLTKQLPELSTDAKINHFGTNFYMHFDKTLKALTLRALYQSGSDLCVFFPAEILAATFILLATVKWAKDPAM